MAGLSKLVRRALPSGREQGVPTAVCFHVGFTRRDDPELTMEETA
jgi:hypothetical protein